MNLSKKPCEIRFGNWTVKKEYLTVSRNDNNSTKEKEGQDVGDENVMYKPLLDDANAETLMNEDGFEIDTGS